MSYSWAEGCGSGIAELEKEKEKEDVESVGRG